MSQAFDVVWTESGRTCEGQCWGKWTWSKQYAVLQCPPQKNCFSAKHVVHDPCWLIAKPWDKHMDPIRKSLQQKKCTRVSMSAFPAVVVWFHVCAGACLHFIYLPIYLYAFVLSINLSAITYLLRSIHHHPPIPHSICRKLCINLYMLGITCTLNTHTTSWSIVMTRANSDAHTYSLSSAHLSNVRLLYFKPMTNDGLWMFVALN